MAKYRIRIEEVVEREEEPKYPDYKTIYEQTSETLEIKSIISAVNK